MIWQKPNILASRTRRRGNGSRGQSVRKDTSAAGASGAGAGARAEARAGSGHTVARNRKDRTGRDDRRDSRKPLDVWVRVPWSEVATRIAPACVSKGFLYRNGQE